jgi:RHS repeat-associated protein
MTYDSYGNILSKNGKVYTYGDDVWKDKLTAYDGQTITYDAQGNPTTYLGHTLTWEKGRQLMSFDGNTYTYNANGIRTSKTINGVKHTYTLDGTKIITETWQELGEDNTEQTRVLTPLYDNENSVCGILYEGNFYYFLKNLQGDIIAITNQNGVTLVRYAYDAWGACTITEDNSNCNIATINPFRYRGYYYDAEIGMYYLQSRYYDPVCSRWINPDSIMCCGIDGRPISFNLLRVYGLV